MRIKERNWKKGVLFACIMLYEYGNGCCDVTVDIQMILKNAEIEKKEIEPILKEYEESKKIKFLEGLIN